MASRQVAALITDSIQNPEDCCGMERAKTNPGRLGSLSGPRPAPDGFKRFDFEPTVENVFAL